MEQVMEDSQCMQYGLLWVGRMGEYRPLPEQPISSQDW